MPKAAPHFDATALLAAVAEQPVGLRVATNNPVRWRAILYAAMRANPRLRCSIYANPASRNSFFLTSRPRPALQAQTITDASDAEGTPNAS